MTTLREAAQQALEALCCVRDMVAHPDNLEFIDKQTTALRAALAAPVQAPHMYPLQSNRMRIDPVTGNVGIGTLSAEPVEPVAWADMDVRGEDKGLSWTSGHFHKTPLYTAPPQRKPLSGEQLRQIELGLRIYYDNGKYDLSLHDFARAIERAHAIGGAA